LCCARPQRSIYKTLWGIFKMAIPFARLEPARLTDRSCAARIIAYTARNLIDRFDYRHLNDLLHEEILLPGDCPKQYFDRRTLANAIDDAEWAKVRTPPSERKRTPQIGLMLTIALPPADEVTLQDAAEIMRRIVLAARGSQPVPIHCAIHGAEINRHAHALFATRLDADGTFGPKVRDFLVRHRVTAQSKGAADIVEGISWPELVSEIQQLFFLELGIDLVVDPVAPVSDKHFAAFRYDNGSFHNTRTKTHLAAARDGAQGQRILH
jgi:MobA/MobL family